MAKVKFDQKKPWSTMHSEGVKFIVQDDNYFSYAEANGPYIEEMKQRILSPTPQFIISRKEYEKKQRMDDYKSLRVKATTAMTELEMREQELRKDGLLEERVATQ